MKLNNWLIDQATWQFFLNLFTIISITSKYSYVSLMWLALQNLQETNKENPQSNAKNVVTLSGNLKSRILQSNVLRREGVG